MGGERGGWLGMVGVWGGQVRESWRARGMEPGARAMKERALPGARAWERQVSGRARPASPPGEEGAERKGRKRRRAHLNAALGEAAPIDTMAVRPAIVVRAFFIVSAWISSGVASLFAAASFLGGGAAGACGLWDG